MVSDQLLKEMMSAALHRFADAFVFVFPFSCAFFFHFAVLEVLKAWNMVKNH
jgi:hypothetical protein